MASNIREAELKISPTAERITELLAAISKLQNRYHEFHQGQLGVPSSLPGDYPHATWTILDALADLLVSQGRPDSIALALRINRNTQSVDIIASKNQDVPPDAVVHLHQIWYFLRRLSNRYWTIHPHSTGETIGDREFRDVSLQFAENCVKFSSKRLKEIINSRFLDIIDVSADVSDPDHAVYGFRDSIRAVQHMLSRDENTFHDVDWRLLFFCLREVEKATDRLYKSDGLLLNHRKLWSLVRTGWLSRVTSVWTSYDNLMKATVSPEFRDLFNLELNVHALLPETGKLSSVARSAKEWEDVLEAALAYNNKYGDPRHTESGVLDLNRIEADAIYMAQERVPREIVVHAETKLLAAIEKTQQEQPELPKAFAYISTTEFPCHGCDCFSRAFNITHGTSWKTKRGYGAACPSWMFPSVLSRRDDILKATYNMIATDWAAYYRGYLPRPASSYSDSPPQPPRGGAVLDFYEEEAQDIMAKMTELRRDMEIR
ncbi:hypothetical protein DTO282E5_331 [Paecilomyces variotii]|nr:hypothetical protein DTO282E5_331 [Paecilomyces variotii]